MVLGVLYTIAAGIARGNFLLAPSFLPPPFPARLPQKGASLFRPPVIYCVKNGSVDKVPFSETLQKVPFGKPALSTASFCPEVEVL